MRSDTLPKWNDKTTNEKILAVSGWLLSILVIILAALQLNNIFEFYIDVFEPVLGVTMFIYFLQYRKYNKFCSYVYLSGAVATFIALFIVFFIL